MAKYYLVSAACLPYIILHVTYLTLIQMPQHLYKILHGVDKSNEGIQKFPLVFIETPKKETPEY
jgi:heme/copper-type cytochrome/quinol oxidase subunit 4